MRTGISVRPAPRRRSLWSVLLLAAALPSGFAAEANPEDLLAAAETRLTAGDLDGAEAALGDLRRLVSATPEWDPDGTFSRRTIPRLESRLARLRSALEVLDTLYETRLREVGPPRVESEGDLLTACVEWAAATLRRIQKEGEEQMAAALPDLRDRAALVRTDRHARAERRLEAEVLRRMSEALEAELDRGLQGDQRSEALRTRLDVVKRSTVDLAVERDAMRKEMDRYQHRIDLLLQVVAELIASGSGPRPDVSEFDSDPIGNIFQRFLRSEQAEVESHPPVSAAERRFWKDRLRRHKNYNRILAAAGIASDQSGALAGLEASVKRVSPWAAGTSGATAAAWGVRIGLALLNGAAAWLGWWASRAGQAGTAGP
ncbi:MAG: hypothetical protein HY509_06270 [Acidobacteria bacterium]|nr:hypothetical protein [Acidobacteriota bacterium]